MPFQIIRNDITKVKADAIVNTANPEAVIGDGTDRAIYQAAGEQKLLAARRKIGKIAPGAAVYTKAFHLAAKYIIHTVGPVWLDGSHGERETLHVCYKNALALALDLKCESIAFPLIATGTYQFPKEEALQIALTEISQFLLAHEMQVTLVVFDRDAFVLSQKLSDGIAAYVDEQAVRAIRVAEYLGAPESKARRAHNKSAKTAETVTADEMVIDGENLDKWLEDPGETFQERLFELIDASGMNEVTVYKKANIDRKLFSRIRSKKDYRPKKKTAVAFAIALELDMPTMTDLLARAGIALSPSDQFDLIISYFVTRRDYDIFEINAALFKYGQPILG